VTEIEGIGRLLNTVVSDDAFYPDHNDSGSC